MTILYRIIKQASNAVTKLQEVVETEQRKLNSMVQSITEGIVMTDKDYRVLVANPAVKEAIGLKNDKVTIFDFIDHLGGKFDIRGKLEESVKLDKTLEAPEVLLGDRFFQIFVSPVKSISGIRKGEILGGVVIFHDITHDKEIEKLREDFVSMVIHELRSPLDGIKKRIEVLREKGVKNDKKAQDDLTKSIYENSSHMLELVNDLLNSAKLESGKFELHKELSDIKQLVEERINFYDILAEDAKVELGFQFGNDLPSKIIFDYSRIEQVINNLVSNAIKFTEPDGKVSVQVLLYKHGQDILKESEKTGIKWFLDNKAGMDINNGSDSLVIAVTDTGIGVAEKDISQLFNKFKQFKSMASRKNESGTGLGLVVAKGIVQEHKGIIGVVSKEGQGSTFYFTIPINLNI